MIVGTSYTIVMPYSSALHAINSCSQIYTVNIYYHLLYTCKKYNLHYYTLGFILFQDNPKALIWTKAPHEQAAHSSLFPWTSMKSSSLILDTLLEYVMY